MKYAILVEHFAKESTNHGKNFKAEINKIHTEKEKILRVWL